LVSGGRREHIWKYSALDLPMGLFQEVLAGIAVLVGAVGIIAGAAMTVWRRHKRHSIREILKRHFRPLPLETVAVTERQFPPHLRADLQRAVDDFVGQTMLHLFTGVKSEGGLGGVDFSSLLDASLMQVAGSSTVGPPQYEHIDIGEEEPIQTLKNGLWLLERNGSKFAILYAPSSDFGECGIVRHLRVQVAAASGESGAEVARHIFRHLETAVLNARCYRGKILSLESDSSYYGHASGVKVHRLSKLERDQVILPGSTLKLLDRNVIDFVKKRGGLSRLRMATKKGLLFYGPPGTGKTHTIRYLAGSLEGHTTLLISSEQVALLGEYMILARLLQPSIVVIEDVDLIARERTRMRSPGSELLLNKLLNEMDGLKEDCDILFILTTNRPEELEAALASRPGRIDQAIEFPLPDPEGRAKLVRLYSRGITVPEEVVQDIVARTHNVSASFIKELMRRSAQFHLERDSSRTLQTEDVTNALDEMLFSGGSLNLKLLGADKWSGGEEG
jgi:cell division protease FtsH